jgi:hypothetical protein
MKEGVGNGKMGRGGVYTERLKRETSTRVLATFFLTFTLEVYHTAETEKINGRERVKVFPPWSARIVKMRFPAMRFVSRG